MKFSPLDSWPLDLNSLSHLWSLLFVFLSYVVVPCPVTLRGMWKTLGNLQWSRSQMCVIWPLKRHLELVDLLVLHRDRRGVCSLRRFYSLWLSLEVEAFTNLSKYHHENWLYQWSMIGQWSVDGCWTEWTESVTLSIHCNGQIKTF